MASRDEDRLAEVSGLGTAYTLVGTVPAATTWNILFNVTSRLASATAKLRLYIADSSWASAEPAAGTLKVAIAYDLPIAAGDVVQLSGIVMKTGEKLVARSDTAASLDIAVNGVKIT